MQDFSKNEWGIVFAGGGGKGAYQIGVIRALFEKKIDNYITMASGTSVGALNMVLFAYGDIEMAQYIWDNIYPRQFLDIKPEMIDLKEGLANREGIKEIFDNYIDFEVISDSDKELYVAVTEIDNNNEVKVKYFMLNHKSKEEIENILLASTALPIIYEPVTIDGIKYRDGGIKDNIPITPLYNRGIRHFIIIELSEKSEVDKSNFQDAEFFIIKPEQSIGDFIDGTLDFTNRGAKLRMERGYLDAIKALE